MYISTIFSRKVPQHREVEIACGWYFEEFRVEARNFLCGGKVPDRGRIPDPKFATPLLQLTMLFQIEFKEFTMRAIAIAITVLRVRMA